MGWLIKKATCRKGEKSKTEMVSGLQLQTGMLVGASG